jgi:hypothetical protein
MDDHEHDGYPKELGSLARGLPGTPRIPYSRHPLRLVLVIDVEDHGG